MLTDPFLLDSGRIKYDCPHVRGTTWVLARSSMTEKLLSTLHPFHERAEPLVPHLQIANSNHTTEGEIQGQPCLLERTGAFLTGAQGQWLQTLRKQGGLSLGLSDFSSFSQLYPFFLPSVMTSYWALKLISEAFSEKTQQSTQAQFSPVSLGHPRIFTHVF